MSNPILSDKTKLRITISAAIASVLFIVGLAFAAGQYRASIEARLTAIETRSTVDREDVNSLVTEMRGFRTDLNDAKVAFTELKTTVDNLVRQQSVSNVRVIPAQSQTRVVTVSSTPSQPQNQNPQQPTSPPQSDPEPEPGLLQPAINPIQKILDELGMLL